MTRNEALGDLRRLRDEMSLFPEPRQHPEEFLARAAPLFEELGEVQAAATLRTVAQHAETSAGEMAAAYAAIRRVNDELASVNNESTMQRGGQA